jgi:hypothetical protein
VTAASESTGMGQCVLTLRCLADLAEWQPAAAVVHGLPRQPPTHARCASWRSSGRPVEDGISAWPSGIPNGHIHDTLGQATMPSSACPVNPPAAEPCLYRSASTPGVRRIATTPELPSQSSHSTLLLPCPQVPPVPARQRLRLRHRCGRPCPVGPVRW